MLEEYTDKLFEIMQNTGTCLKATSTVWHCLQTHFSAHTVSHISVIIPTPHVQLLIS